jgi:medium-chain acyl-[acyl-carrier-protein] hydrolase
MGRLFALRNFSIINPKGEIIGTARSAWLVLDLKSRRPQRVEPLFKRILPLLDRPAEAEEPEKIPDSVHPREENLFKVRYSDIDMHHHVNNTKYIEWVLDRYPYEMNQTHHIHTLEINFLAESSHGDEISVHTEPLGDSPPAFLHSVFRKGDGRELCRARIIWRQID